MNHEIEELNYAHFILSMLCESKEEFNYERLNKLSVLGLSLILLLAFKLHGRIKLDIRRYIKTIFYITNISRIIGSAILKIDNFIPI